MRHILTLMTCLLAIVLISCKASQDFPRNYNGDQLHFGQGGGFTGEVNAFVLLDDGRLYEKKDTTMTYKSKWDSQFTGQIFVNYNMLQLESIDHNQPGNLYYFIEFYRNGEKEPHRIVWGREGHPPAQKVVNFYQILYQSTRDKS